MDHRGWAQSCVVTDRTPSRRVNNGLEYKLVQIPINEYEELGRTVLRSYNKSTMTSIGISRSGFDTNESTILGIHPILYDHFLQVQCMFLTSSKYDEQDLGTTDSSSSINHKPTAKIQSLPHLESYFTVGHDCIDQNDRLYATITDVEYIKPLPLHCTIHIECIYCDNDISGSSEAVIRDEIAWALQNSVIAAHATVLLYTKAFSYALCVVHQIYDKGDSDIAIDKAIPAQPYIAGPVNKFHVKLSSRHILNYTGVTDGNYLNDTVTCPGYNSTLQDLYKAIVDLHGSSARPAGVVVSGCAGVGKTFLVSCLCEQVKRVSWRTHWVSIEELLVKASYSDYNELLEYITPSHNDNNMLLVVFDNYTLLKIDRTTDSINIVDSEQQTVCAAVIKCIDDLVRLNIPIIAIAEDVDDMPTGHAKANRLEKEIKIDTPSQAQREAILFSIMSEIGIDETMSYKWANMLSSVTPGCVAGDLKSLVTQASTRSQARSTSYTLPHWEDMAEAARQCIPSQLALLDVTKAPVLPEDVSRQDWISVHNYYWQTIAGYTELKKHVYRSVVLPWQMFTSRSTKSAVSKQQITPPRGVLFHGPSGTGKTLAASCLAGSLGLPTINIRASDILDKYLGGSETLLRSIFAKARSASPCILLFDEIDSIASNRSDGQDDGGSDVHDRLLSTLLNEMDGVNSSNASEVLVVACTNRKHALDSALLRPGRLEEHVYVPLPAQEDVYDILCLYLQQVDNLPNETDLRTLCGKLANLGIRCSDIEGLAREAVLKAIRDTKDDDEQLVLTIDTVQYAVDSLRLVG